MAHQDKLIQHHTHTHTYTQGRGGPQSLTLRQLYWSRRGQSPLVSGQVRSKSRLERQIDAEKVQRLMPRTPLAPLVNVRE